MKKPEVPQPANPLFTNGENFHMNACVGDNGGPYDFFAYGRGFFEGGHAIVRAAQENVAPVDYLVYPAAFSYRHGIELLLKQLVVSLNAILENGEGYPKGHRIDKLWERIQERNEAVEAELIEREAVERAGAIIGHFHEFDPAGQVFRYPEDTDGGKHLTGYKLINVEELCGQMKELQEILERWYYQAGDIRAWQVEQTADYGLLE